MKIELKPEWQDQAEAAALLRLMKLCFRHHGGSTVPIMYFLCSLWNGYDYKPDMQLLCKRIDPEHFEDVLTVMRLMRRTGETHDFFVNGDEVMLELSKYIKRTREEEEPEERSGM